MPWHATYGIFMTFPIRIHIRNGESLLMDGGFFMFGAPYKGFHPFPGESLEIKSKNICHDVRIPMAWDNHIIMVIY
jgi:hypothetical protein